MTWEESVVYNTHGKLCDWFSKGDQTLCIALDMVSQRNIP